LSIISATKDDLNDKETIAFICEECEKIKFYWKPMNMISIIPRIEKVLTFF